MLSFMHDIPTKVYFGKGQIRRLEESLRAFGTRVLLCYGGGSNRRTGLYDEVRGILDGGGFAVTELAGIEPNPRVGTAERGVRLCRENSVEMVLAVGGGSVIDCAKAIAAGVYREDGDLWKMVCERDVRGKSLPLVVVLTVSATGSEFDPTAVISNPVTHEKLGVHLAIPAVSILDPEYTFSVPAEQTAAGSADILSHILEGYFSATEDSDIADGLAETVMRTVIRYMPVALREPDNYTARANLMMASSIGCSHMPEYGKEPTGWPCHGLEHELSAWYDLTHGVGLAILTPRWMRHILAKDPSCEWRFVRFARNVWGLGGEDGHALALAGIEALERLFREAGLPSTLGEVGIGPERIPEMAAHADRGGRLGKGLVPLTPADAEEIYRACL